MTGSLEARLALVTGASRGIGQAIAQKLAREGATVAVHYSEREESARATVAAIEGAGGKAFLLQADLTDTASIAAMFVTLDRKLDELGAQQIDILVNNAGVTAVGDITQLTEGDYDRVFDTNVKGLFFVTQKAVPRIRDGGRIINISSMVSHNAYPAILAYAATKAAIDSLTISLAAGLGPRGITVNAIAPGATITDFIRPLLSYPGFVDRQQAITALGRLGEPIEIADVVAFVASDAAKWITGERIRASGGMHL